MAHPDTVVNISEKCATIDQLWSPKIIAEANGWHVKLVKSAGEFVWHTHEETDEIFMVISGQGLSLSRGGVNGCRAGATRSSQA